MGRAQRRDHPPPQSQGKTIAGDGRHHAPPCLSTWLGAVDPAPLWRTVRPLPPLRRQQCLFQGGATGGYLFLLRSGCLRTSVQEPSGEEQVMDFLLPGDVTGAGTGIESFHGSRVVALERSSVCAARMDALRALATWADGLQDWLCRQFEHALSNNVQHVLAMGRRSARQRVALFLYTWARRRHAAGFSWAELHLPMRREDIASYLGLVTETTSRALSRLRDDGVIELEGRHLVRILDADALAVIADIDALRYPLGGGGRESSGDRSSTRGRRGEPDAAAARPGR